MIESRPREFGGNAGTECESIVNGKKHVHRSRPQDFIRYINMTRRLDESRRKRFEAAERRVVRRD